MVWRSGGKIALRHASFRRHRRACWTALCAVALATCACRVSFVRGPPPQQHGAAAPLPSGVERRQAELRAPDAVGAKQLAMLGPRQPPDPPGPQQKTAEQQAVDGPLAAVAGLGLVGLFASQMPVVTVLQDVLSWSQAAASGLVSNRAPGIGGIIEDVFLGMIVALSCYCLSVMFTLKRKSSSMAGHAHTVTGALQILVVLWAIVQERCFREAPGAQWAVLTFVVYMVNNVTMWPLLKYFKGQEVHRMLFKLAYSFILSFQGILVIAWSLQYEWLYWAVMPFWFYSVKKLLEASDNIFALLPDGAVPVPGLQDAARRRVSGIENDVPTIVYSTLNFAGAVFDNLYMAVYTWRGPTGFWGWSLESIEGVNDHLRTGLTKPAFCSLTISILVFLGTLVHRKIISQELALVLNVVLASIGPWLILYYHKLIDWSEPWQPEIMGDWGSVPYLLQGFMS